MQWQERKPRRQGRYWCREKGDTEHLPWIMDVWKGPEGLALQSLVELETKAGCDTDMFGAERVACLLAHVRNRFYEWAGPIPPPQESK